MGAILFLLFSRDPSHNALEGGVFSHVIHGLKLSGRRHFEHALLLTAYRMAQGQRQKGVRAPDRLVLDLETLRDSSTFASGQHAITGCSMRLCKMARFGAWCICACFCTFLRVSAHFFLPKWAAKINQICAEFCKHVQKAFLCNTPFSYTPFACHRTAYKQMGSNQQFTYGVVREGVSWQKISQNFREISAEFSHPFLTQ